MKFCPKCGKKKPESDFYTDKSRLALNKLSGHCKDCKREQARFYASKNRVEIIEYHREHYRKNRAKYRDRFLKSKYGITENDFLLMLKRQRGRCAICKRHHKKCARGRCLGVALHVDHDHATGRIRGLLCHHCNHRLDMFTSEKLLLRTLQYIKHSTYR